MKARSLFAVALAAMLVPVVVTAAPRPAGRTASPFDGGLSVGGFIGYETDDLSGISLRLDGEMPFQALSPQVGLSWVGSIGYSRLTEDEGVFGVSTDLTANILKLVPAARFSLAVTPEFTLFADAGLGLYFSSWEIETARVGFPDSSVDDNDVGLLMRIGAGAWFAANPTTRIGAMIELDPYFGDVIGNADQTTFLFQAGAMFRM